VSADAVRQIADAVLYEGYILWPYRRSALKNRQRWTFGGVYPREHSRDHPDDRWEMRTECLLQSDGDATLDVRVRFLHVVRRQVEHHGEPVDELVVDGERHLSWEEATEREVGAGQVAIAAGHHTDRLGEDAAVTRSWHALTGAVQVGRVQRRPGLELVTVQVANQTPWTGGTREDALARTLCSAHVVLHTDGGAFVSLTDPPDDLRAEAEACRNVGVWPVLVGQPGDRSTMLASPIILEDHPRIAPESPGDLFDGGEIDQLLVLNILGLTDEEKEEMRATDPRVREILERTESLTPEQLMRLHGTMRDLRHVSG
jgi:hydrogenase maturation protease